jgi:hypothetical protein
MTARSGGYITRRLHVPNEVWSQGGVRLAALPEKARVLEILAMALEDLAAVSRTSFGPLGTAAPGDSVQKAAALEWIGKLEDFVGSCDGVVAAFGKKLGLGESVIVKKTTGVRAVLACLLARRLTAGGTGPLVGQPLDKWIRQSREQEEVSRARSGKGRSTGG